MTEAPPGSVTFWPPRPAEQEGWTASAADGARVRLAVEAAGGTPALRLDFTLAGHGSWAIARHERALALPPHWVMVLALRGAAPPAELQVKLVDAGGATVWWWRLPAHAFQPQGERLVLRRAALEGAWGPASGGDPERLRALEVAVASDAGATGTLWIEALRLEPRPPQPEPPHVVAVRASSAGAVREPAPIPPPSPSQPWRAHARDPRPWLQLDLGATHETGGVLVDVAPGETLPDARLAGSDDGTRWTPIAHRCERAGARSWLRATDAEARWLRLELAEPCTVTGVAAVPLALAVSPARHAAAAARRAPRGRYPRHLAGEQGEWAVVGADGDGETALLGEDGALETRAEGWTIEPMLWTGERLVTWADVRATPSLADGCLPVPSVDWTRGPLRLAVTACAAGDAGASTLVVRYRVTNATAECAAARLLLAVRPYQVNPAWQSLGLSGGFAPIRELAMEAGVVQVNGGPGLVAITRPDAFGAAASPEEALDAMACGSVPASPAADDPTGLVHGVLAFDLALAPGTSAAVAVAVPLHAAASAPPALLAPGAAAAWAEAQLGATIAWWRRRLGRVPIALPPQAAALEQTLRASLAWILVLRDGPRLQPGPRCYRRSWIRDGALTSAALAEMGFADEARAFLRWYAPHQAADGRVPCAIDRHGPDPTPEHDSHGELVWGVVELYRLTGDRAFLVALWPHVLGAVGAIEALRAERLGGEHRGRPTEGLLPESISHEGYAGRPVHSYWDDFFAVRALADAAWAAGVLGDAAAATHVAALCEAMRRDLHASIAATMAQHALDVLPGSVELGDFDPTSSAIAVDPCAEAARLPPGALARTFARYWRELDARRGGVGAAAAYTPYEVRNATALLHLGWQERALALLAWLVGDQRPAPWRQWPEVAWRDRRAPRFLGDLPHGWVAASFVRALRRLLVWERDDGGVLLVGAGVPEAWAREPPGVRADGLPTHFGRLDLAIAPAASDAVAVRLGGEARPPGGFLVAAPGGRMPRQVLVDGREAEPAATIAVAPGTAEIRFRS